MPAKHDHRSRVHVGVGDTGDGIGRARTGGNYHDARAAADAGIPLSHMSRALLMADQDMLHLGVKKRVVGGQNRAAGVSEDDVDPFGHETLDYDLSTGQLLHRHFIRKYALNAVNLGETLRI